MSVLRNTGPMKKHYSYTNNGVYMCVYVYVCVPYIHTHTTGHKKTLFDQKYSKNSNIMKYYYNLK